MAKYADAVGLRGFVVELLRVTRANDRQKKAALGGRLFMPIRLGAGLARSQGTLGVHKRLQAGATSRNN